MSVALWCTLVKPKGSIPDVEESRQEHSIDRPLFFLRPRLYFTASLSNFFEFLAVLRLGVSSRSTLYTKAAIADSKRWSGFTPSPPISTFIHSIGSHLTCIAISLTGTAPFRDDRCLFSLSMLWSTFRQQNALKSSH